MRSKSLNRLYNEAVINARRALSAAEEMLTKYETIDDTVTRLENLGADVLFISQGWDNSVSKIYCGIPESFGGAPTRRDKATFSSFVSRIAQEFNEAPDISVETGQYMADFKENKIHFYTVQPVDCKVVEHKETKEVVSLRPHPACIEALKSLEQL